MISLLLFLELKIGGDDVEDIWVKIKDETTDYSGLENDNDSIQQEDFCNSDDWIGMETEAEPTEMEPQPHNISYSGLVLLHFVISLFLTYCV